MKKTIGAGEGYVRLATESGAPKKQVTFWAEGKKTALTLRPAVAEPDGYAYVALSRLTGALEIEGAFSSRFISAADRRPAFYAESFRFRPALGRLLSLLKLDKTEEGYELSYAHDPFGEGDNPRVGRAFSRDLLYWQETEEAYRLFGEEAEGGAQSLTIGDAELYLEEGALFARQKGEGGYAPLAAAENLRVWMRRWQDLYLQPGDDFSARLAIRVAPDAFPNIRLLPAEGIPNEISTALLDISAEIPVEKSGQAELCLAGAEIALDFYAKKLRAGDHEWGTGPAGSVLKLRLLLDHGDAELYVNGVCASFKAARQDRVALLSKSRKLILNDLRVYGLRGLWLKPEEQRRIEEMGKSERLFAQSQSYRIYEDRVEDLVYGEPWAYVPDDETVISPLRAVEEFQWRKGGMGDMTRAVNRTTVWHPRPEIDRYPQVSTGLRTVDAAYKLALDVFSACGGDEFARPGEEGMWAAGQFQGPGAGFGVWVRDTAHIALRGGAFIDPEGARKSLLYTTKNGFDNGIDGICMPIVGLYDYYLVTGDVSAAAEVWENLKARANRLVGLFDGEKNLVFADQSTSNDAFPEPECGNFALSTQIYFLNALESMAKLAPLMGEEPNEEWADKAGRMRKAIREDYWKEEAGYFTSGPKGSESYEKGYWESCGEEAAVWPKFGIGEKEQTARVFDNLPRVAMNEFGVNVFPYRKEVNHFCNAAWAAWTAGMAAAAAGAGRPDILKTFIAQQTRNALLNKTFYEVVDYQSGKAWRWPGQLWHAAAFISYFLFGVLGIRYGEEGLTLTPCVPEELADMSVYNVKYRGMELDFTIVGSGTKWRMFVNGEEAEGIPASAQGSVEVVLKSE